MNTTQQALNAMREKRNDEPLWTVDPSNSNKSPAPSAPVQKTEAKVPSEKKAPALLNIVNSDDFKKKMALALPKFLTADRLARVVMNECHKTPALLNCNQGSFLGAILQCAQLGLEPGSALGHCYILPFGSGKAQDGRPNAQLIIGYRGMIDLARRSGQIVSLAAYIVHQEDEFDYQLGLQPNIVHKPAHQAKPGPVTFVYAVANLKGGGVQFEVMSRAEIEAVRDTSKAGKNGPWVTHFDEMAKKTVIRRLFKYLPVSIEIARAVEVDERSDRGEAVTQEEVLDGEFIDKGVIAA